MWVVFITPPSSPHKDAHFVDKSCGTKKKVQKLKKGEKKEKIKRRRKRKEENILKRERREGDSKGETFLN